MTAKDLLFGQFRKIVHHQEKPQDSSISEDRNRTILAGENALLEIEARVAGLHP